MASVREDHERSDRPARKGSLGDTRDGILPDQPSHSQAVTFCRTVDGINLAVAVAGRAPRS